jgi:hypothetical protein
MPIMGISLKINNFSEHAKIVTNMSNRPAPSSAAFMGLAAITLIGAASLLAAAWPHALKAAHKQSDRLVAEAGTVSINEAAADYNLATWLNRSNQPAYLGLARTQIATGKAAQAVDTLGKAGQGSEASKLRIRTLLELNRPAEAADLANNLTQPGHSDEDLTLAAIAFALANRPDSITPLIPLMSSPEAAQRVIRIEAGKLPLATELYAYGLPESSRALLVTLPVSFERDQLLGRIYTDRLAERVGFEPTEALRPHRISSAAH